MFFGDCEADAGFAFFLAVQHLEKEETAAALFALADCKKLRAALEPPDNRFDFVGLQFARHVLSGIPALGRKTLAAAGAASNDDLAAALSGHTRTETVAALANKLRGLIGTL